MQLRRRRPRWRQFRRRSEIFEKGRLERNKEAASTEEASKQVAPKEKASKDAGESVEGGIFDGEGLEGGDFEGKCFRCTQPARPFWPPQYTPHPPLTMTLHLCLLGPGWPAGLIIKGV
jgi:hypothetical protein